MPSDDEVYAGVDVGGTGLRAGLIGSLGGLRGRLVDEHREPDLLGQLRRVGKTLREQAETAAVAIRGAGIAIPGSVDPRTNLIGSVPTAPSLRGLDPAGIDLDGIRVRAIVNDANSALVGECLSGAAAGADHAVGMFIGTGVGGGAYIAGHLLGGRFGHAGEVGHIVVEPDGRSCPCGGRGCLEQYASGTAVARWYAERSGDAVTNAAEVAVLAANGNQLARAAFTELGRRLGTAAATLANLFNPGIVVIGGGVAAVADLFVDELRRTAKIHTMPLTSQGLRIEVGTLGRRAGVTGAAVLARRADQRS